MNDEAGQLAVGLLFAEEFVAILLFNSETTYTEDESSSFLRNVGPNNETFV
jgi:hypothetical protein